MASEVRVRFAPSPTGYLHVGGLRTALYNFLFAKHNNGKLVLRIEDTDQSRKVEGAVENLISSLKWAGIDYDEGPDREGKFGPYIQSQRLHIYQDIAAQLINSSNAYFCFCTPKRLEDLRQELALKKQQLMYDRNCRELPLAEAQRRRKSGEQYVVRMKVPFDGELKFKDVIRGEVAISYKVLDDQVILKSDGFPTYHLAVVVDDHMMGITHVIRGEEWLPSVPKHILLYQYLKWELPVFAHLPLLLNPDKSKLSKRQGDVAVEDYRAKGYLPEAIINFVALLGWNPGDDREIFSMDELEKEFSLERVGKSGAVFNIEKLNWLNGHYIRKKTNTELADAVLPFLKEKGIEVSNRTYLESAMHLMRERMETLSDFVDSGLYFFRDPDDYDEKGKQKYWQSGTNALILKLADRFEAMGSFNYQSIEQTVRGMAEENQIKVTALIHPTRLAVSGKTGGPGLFEMLEVLGREKTVIRLRKACEKLG